MSTSQCWVSLAACIALGLCYRAATVLFFLGFTYVFLLDQTDYLNHFYLVCLYSFLLTLVPAHRAFSVDAVLRPKLRKSNVPAWSLWVMRAQICVVYFMGGIAKLNSDWLHGEPMRHWLADNMDFPLLGRYFTREWMVYAFSWGGLCFDLSIVPLILWRRTRWLGFILAACFNMMNPRLFHIGIFPWLAFCSTVLLFADYSWLRRTFPRLWGEPAQPGETPACRVSIQPGATRHRRSAGRLVGVSDFHAAPASGFLSRQPRMVGGRAPFRMADEIGRQRWRVDNYRARPGHRQVLDRLPR